MKGIPASITQNGDRFHSLSSLRVVVQSIVLSTDCLLLNLRLPLCDPHLVSVGLDDPAPGPLSLDAVDEYDTAPSSDPLLLSLYCILHIFSQIAIRNIGYVLISKINISSQIPMDFDQNTNHQKRAFSKGILSGIPSIFQFSNFQISPT